MKIKSKIDLGAIKTGDVLEALKSPINNDCVAYDSNGVFFTFTSNYWERVDETLKTEALKNSSESGIFFTGVLGEEKPSSILIEFKK